ncbi:MAG: molybdopterin molybdotransferase MoeA [Acinetobacter sp.]
MSLISYDQALKNLTHQLLATEQVESVPLLQAQGRILASNVVATQDSPAFDNSAMDGYAICGLNESIWQLVAYIATGDSTQDLVLQAGQAVRIFTGAAVPKGTDAVLIQEEVDVTDDFVSSINPIKARQHIRLRAEEYRQGTVLIAAQQVLNATHIGIAASQGYTGFPCYQKLKVCVFSSGNELQALGQKLKENQIYDSNRLLLMALLKQNQFLEVSDGGLLPDQQDIIQQSLAQAANQNDVVLISGGASVGDKDYSIAALQCLGSIQQWKLAIKPGKPFGWGRINQAQVFVLPGNPVACWVTYLILVLPALKILAGLTKQQALPMRLQAKAQFSIDRPQSRQQFLRGQLAVEFGQLHAKIHSSQSSAMLANCGSSNALVIVPAQQTIRAGQSIQVIYLKEV